MSPVSNLKGGSAKFGEPLLVEMLFQVRASIRSISPLFCQNSLLRDVRQLFAVRIRVIYIYINIRSEVHLNSEQ